MKTISTHLNCVTPLILGSLLAIFGTNNAFSQELETENLPRPDGLEAEMTKPIKVFILLGQSNMIGFGRTSLLKELATTETQWDHLITGIGGWSVRKDVRNVAVSNNKDVTNDWLTAGTRETFGPDLQFGYIMGEVLEEPVLILKSCIGNRSLGFDLLPPGSISYEFDGRTYAGFGDLAASWPVGEAIPTEGKRRAGEQYEIDVSSAKEVLNNLSKYYPGYTESQGYEIAGFVFWQGYGDQQVPAYAKNYQENLKNFIKSIRTDFEAPEAKFAIATIGHEGENMTGDTKVVAEAQLTVDGENGTYPEFKGNVRTIDSRSFWLGGGAHYGGYAKPYLKVGNALGWAMAKMLKAE